MLWMLPVVFALFWLTTYRKTMAMPPLWNMRAVSLQSGAILDFTTPVVGAAAWMGSREARRHTAELMSITARPRWARLLTTWTATTCWALVGYLVCLAVLYGMTAHQASWAGRCGGRPRSWPRACQPYLRSGSPPGSAAEPVHGTAGGHRGVLRARAQHPAHRRQPVVLAGLTGSRCPLGRRIEREHGDLLPLRS